MKQRHRIFIAINLPAEIKKYLAKFQEKWPELPAKWVNADNLHITLVFLGDLTDQELGEVCMAVKNLIARPVVNAKRSTTRVRHPLSGVPQKSFDITLNSIGYGPDNKIPPRMIWASGEKSKELSLFKKDLENALLEKVNFKPEERSFNPHITLARISTFLWRQIEPEERPEVHEAIDLTFTVESIEVMSSEARSRFEGDSLKRSGPHYMIIESHQLH